LSASQATVSTVIHPAAEDDLPELPPARPGLRVHNLLLRHRRMKETMSVACVEMTAPLAACPPSAPGVLCARVLAAGPDVRLCRPDGELAAAIEAHFGSFDAFAAQLTTATTSVQGSGWGVLAWEPVGRRLIVQQVYDHHGNVGIGSTPLLVFDAWEHSYYLQYRNVRSDYVKKLWNLVSWDDVARRYAAAVTAVSLQPVP
jgi:hypothetical protein